jgi:hypothetical protein
MRLPKPGSSALRETPARHDQLLNAAFSLPSCAECEPAPPNLEDMLMRKTVTAIIATAGVATALIATPKPAEARCIGCWVGAGIAAGIIGGALASRSYGYGYGYGYPAYSYGYGYPAYSYGYGYPAYSGYAYAPRRYYARRYYRY